MALQKWNDDDHVWSSLGALSGEGPSKSKETSLEEIVLEELMCAVCFDYASPPILTCRNSHVCCQACNSRVYHCPQCRGEKAVTRAYVLERLYNSVDLRCRMDGCTFKAKGKKFRNHIDVCVHQEIVCPLKRKLGCKWQSKMKTLPQHLEDYHKGHVVFDGKSFQRVVKFATNTGDHAFALIFCVEGKVFLLCFSSFQTLPYMGIVRLNMYEIANSIEGPTTKHKFDLKFSSDLEAPEDETNYVNLSAGIAISTVDKLLIDGAANNFKKGNYFTLNHRWLLDACNKDGDLRYKVSISKVEKPSENDFYCKLRKRLGDEEPEELDWDLAAAF